jgi:Ala-tRNA(Pro) deacylase
MASHKPRRATASIHFCNVYVNKIAHMRHGQRWGASGALPCATIPSMTADDARTSHDAPLTDRAAVSSTGDLAADLPQDVPSDLDAPLAPLTVRLVQLLIERGVPHRVLRHPPVRTSEEASQVRGTPLDAGAKALVCHADERVVLIVVPADARLDNRAFKQQAGVKNVRMIDPERILELVGAPVGAVPPFGSLFGLPTYADQEVVEREVIAFNAGGRDISVTMRGPDFALLEQPIIGHFARRASE